MKTITKNWYYVEANTEDGDRHNKIHKEDCLFMPKRENRIYLGNFSIDEDAIIEAEKYFPQKVNTCTRCCRKD